VGDPRLPSASVRKRIGVRNALVFGDELPSLQVPPDVRIRDIPRRHTKNAEEEDC